ncbi:MAG TPA: hypothetical protein VH255_08760, partial [Verrucomicrobiae bacterium]|nr:hypothetical protein [Verrucomicrobiae bacterium]
AAAPVSITLKDLGLMDECQARDLWEHKDLGTITNEFAPVIPSHGAGLFRISGAVASVQSSDTKN